VAPIVVWPDGRVEQGFGDALGCFTLRGGYFPCNCRPANRR
jgi:hypothetical protein